MAALLDSDRERAGGVAAQALTDCGSRIGLVSDYLQPALYAIGELWYQGAIHALDEQRASEIMADVLAQLEPTPSREPVAPGSHVLLTALVGEEHLLGMRILGMVLEDQGWDVDVLEPTMFGHLLQLTDELQPQVVGISCGYLPDPHHLAGVISELKARRCKVMVGGPAMNRAPGLWSRLGADATGIDARVAAVTARQQLARWRERAALEARFGSRHSRRSAYAQSTAVGRAAS